MESVPATLVRVSRMTRVLAREGFMQYVRD